MHHKIWSNRVEKREKAKERERKKEKKELWKFRPKSQFEYIIKCESILHC